MNSRAIARKALREQIAQTAYEMFRENGYEKTTVRAISAALGMSTRNYFRYFPTKEDVLMETTHNFKVVFLDAFFQRLTVEDIWEAMKNSIVQCTLLFTSHHEEEVQAFIRATPALFSRQLEIFECMVSDATEYYMLHHAKSLSRMVVSALIRSGFTCLQSVQESEAAKVSEDVFIDLMGKMKPVLLVSS